MNIGDILIDEDGDIHGDGVNVAARIEAEAEPGGVALSSRAHDDVVNHIPTRFINGGEQTLKNIERPVRIWRWMPEREVGTPEVEKAIPPPINPSIAVLPFANVSGDPEQGFICDGIADDITTALSKASGLTVIARNSTFTYKDSSTDVRQIGRELDVRYVLEGSVRRSGRRLRLGAQLVDVSNGQQVWADRYDRVLDDVFELQDDITREVVTALRGQLTEALTR